MSLIKIVYPKQLTATATMRGKVKQGSNLRNLDGGTFYRITSWVYSTGTWHMGNQGKVGEQEEVECISSNENMLRVLLAKMEA